MQLLAGFDPMVTVQRYSCLLRQFLVGVYTNTVFLFSSVENFGFSNFLAAVDFDCIIIARYWILIV